MNRARLLLISEKGSIEEEFNISNQSVILGRASQSNFAIQNEEVSRFHAQIQWNNNGFFISDMGSTNGTFINGMPVTPKKMFQVYSNDTIELGSVKLLFQIVPNTVPSATRKQQAAANSIPSNYQVPLSHNLSNSNTGYLTNNSESQKLEALKQAQREKIAIKNELQNQLNQKIQEENQMSVQLLQKATMAIPEKTEESNNKIDVLATNKSQLVNDYTISTSSYVKGESQYEDYIDSVASDSLSKKIEDLYKQQVESNNKHKKEENAKEYYQDKYDLSTKIFNTLRINSGNIMEFCKNITDNQWFLFGIIGISVVGLITYYLRFSPIFG